MIRTLPQRGEIRRLYGSNDLLALVLYLSPSVESRGDTGVLVVPCLTSYNRAELSFLDVICPVGASTLGQELVLLAWATAEIPLNCIAAVVGGIHDEAVFDAIRDVRLAAVDPAVKPAPAMVGSIDPTIPALDWHREVSKRLRPYWDGTVAESRTFTRRLVVDTTSFPKAFHFTGRASLAIQLSEKLPGLEFISSKFWSLFKRPKRKRQVSLFIFDDEQVWRGEATLNPTKGFKFYCDAAGTGYIIAGVLKFGHRSFPQRLMVREPLRHPYGPLPGESTGVWAIVSVKHRGVDFPDRVESTREPVTPSRVWQAYDAPVPEPVT